MNWSERQDLKHRVEKFDELQKQISRYELAINDLGGRDGWNFEIKTLRIPDGGSITAFALDKETQKIIRLAIEKDLEKKVAILRNEIDEL